MASRKSNSNPIKNMLYLDTGQMTRTRRLLTIALQLPQIENLCRKLYAQRKFEAIQRYFKRWTIETALWRKELLRRNQLLNVSSIVIQKIARGFLGRNRFHRLKQLKAEQRIRDEQNALLKLQNDMRLKLLREQAMAELEEFLKKKQQKSAVLIQKAFRGYLLRGELVLHERKKLLHQLRSWAHGITNNLYSNRDLQSMELQAMIYTAVHFTSIPSKPIRNLPTLDQIKKYRAGVFAVRWKIANQYNMKKLEMKKRKEECFLMQYEEILSKAYERSFLLREEKLALKQRAEQMLLQRELLEAERRNANMSHQFLQDLQNRKQIDIREQQEALWRVEEAKRKDREAHELALRTLQKRELELMKHEDLLSKLFHEEYGHYQVSIQERENEFQSILQKLYQNFQQKRVLNMKLYNTAFMPTTVVIQPGYHAKQQYQNKSYDQLKLGERTRIRHNMPYSMTYGYMFNQLKLQLSIWIESWKYFLSTLPLKSKYSLQAEESFRAQFINNDTTIDRLLNQLVQNNCFSYQHVYKHLHLWSLTSTKLYAMSLTKSMKSAKEATSNNMIQLASQLVKYFDLFTFGEDLFSIDNDSDQISVGSSFSQTQSYNAWKEMCQPDTVFESLDMKTMNVVLRDYMELNIKLNDKAVLSRPNSLRRNSSYNSTSSPSTPIRPFSGKKNSGGGPSNSPQFHSPTTPSSTNSASSKYSYRPTSTGKSSKAPKKSEQKRPRANIVPTFVRPPNIPAIPFSSAPQFNLPLSYRLIYPVERLTKLYYLIQYSYLVKMREEKYQILFQSKALFQTVHDQLFQLRQNIKSSKLLRFERQQQLQKASEYENTLAKVRKSMISSGLWLYESLFYEIKLFLMLFYSKQDLMETPWLEPDVSLGEKFESSFASRKDRFRRNTPGSSSRLTSTNRSSSNLNRTNSRRNVIDGKGFGKIRITQPRQLFTYSLKSMKKSHLARSKTFKKVIKAKNVGSKRGSKLHMKQKYSSKKNQASSKSLKVIVLNQDDDEGNTTASLDGDDNSSIGSKSISSIGSNKSSGGGLRNTTMFNSSSTVSDNLQLSPSRSRKRLDQEFISNQIPILPIESGSSDNSSLLSSSLYHGNSNSGRNTPSTNHRNTTARANTKSDVQSPSVKVQTFSNINDKFRTFNLKEDDHESYWYDLHIEAFHTITPLDMLKLTVPPFPSYEHDGRPHFVKPKMKASNRKFVYDSDSSEQSENSGSPHKSRQTQYSRGRMKDGQSNTHRSKTAFMNARIANFSNNLKNSRKKERKFFDIPGENLFLESNIQNYDFYIWCEALIEWIQNILHWKFPLESQWKDQQIADCFACLQRLEYLSSFTIDIEDASIEEVLQRHGVATNAGDQNNKRNPYSILSKSEATKKRIAKSSVMTDAINDEKTIFMMKLLEEAKVQEMYEILLYKSDIYVTTRYQGKEYKLTIDADSLDEFIGRHPISLFIREMMLLDVQYFQSSKLITSLSYSKSISMIDLVEQHQNSLLLSTANNQSMGDSFLSSKKLELFNVLSKEIYELEQTIQSLISRRLLTFHVYHPQKSLVNTGLYFTPLVLPSNWYDCKRVVSKECMLNIQTDEHWLFQFPAYMQPVIHFGTPAPPETFIRRLLREQKEGSQGKYSRIHRLDKRIDVLVKKFLKELKKRQAVTKFLMEYFEKQRKYEIDRTLMMLEDKLGIVHRYKRNMQLLEMAQSACCFRLCGICCLPKYAKIHLETSSFQEKQYYRAMEKLKQLEKQLRYLRNYPIHFKNSMFSKVWKSIVANNYKRTDEFTRLCNEFKIELVELADFRKLAASLDAIDKFIEKKQFIRTHSWITGEAVSFNSEGNILDPKELILPKLTEMSSAYSKFFPISFDNKLDDALVASRCCQESFIAGGLKSAICMLRVVESNDVNARGTILFEPYSAETITNALKVGGKDYFSDIYMKFVPKIFPASSSNQLQIFWSNMTQKIIRTGCALFPVCENSPTHLADVVTFRQHYLQNKSLEYFTHERTKDKLLQPAQLLPVICGIVLKARYHLEDVVLKRLIILQATVRGFLTRKRKSVLS